MSEYKIGQYRFGGSGCVTDLSSKITEGYIQSDISGEGFYDLVYEYKDGFSIDSDYYINVKVPQNANYDYTFNVKLLRPRANTTQTLDYQYVGTFRVPRGGMSPDLTETVVMFQYPASSGYNTNIRVAILKKNAIVKNQNGSLVLKDPNNESIHPAIENGALYSDGDTGNGVRYYYATGGKLYDVDNRFNDIILEKSWFNTDHEVSYGNFEFTFRPVENGFTKIVVEMARGAVDYNIRGSAPDGSSQEAVRYGRIIDKDIASCSLYKMSNLVDKIVKTNIETEEKELSRIGVWGRPGLIMAINGETIRVGNSGFYEFSSIPISSLGVVAGINPSFNDNFTIDWIYQE